MTKFWINLAKMQKIKYIIFDKNLKIYFKQKWSFSLFWVISNFFKIIISKLNLAKSKKILLLRLYFTQNFCAKYYFLKRIKEMLSKS